MNHGVILGRRPRDFAGGTLPYVVLNQSGDWSKWLPLGEWQRDDLVDTMACVSFSLNHCIETQEYAITGTQTRYSSRWLAMMSGTTPSGNYLGVVADTVKKYGLVKYESWPFPDNYTWESFYAVPDPATMQKLKAEGAEWLKTHNVAYEFETTALSDIMKHLKHAPLQIVIPGHAIENFYTVPDVVNYFDSYSPWKKQTTAESLSDVFKLVLTVKGQIMSNAVFAHKAGTQEYGFWIPATSPEAIKDKALNLGLGITNPDGTVDFASAKEVQGL